MDGRENAIQEKKSKVDKVELLANKKPAVILRKASSTEKDVTSVPASVVHQKGSTDGLSSSPETGVPGNVTDASAAPDIRPWPGGRSVEVRGPNAASGSRQLYPGKSGSTSSENSQQATLTEAKPARGSSTDDNQKVSDLIKLTPGGSEFHATGADLGCSTKDLHNSPTAPIPEPRSPLHCAADPTPLPRTSVNNDSAAMLYQRSLKADIHGVSSLAPNPSPRSPPCFSTADIQERPTTLSASTTALTGSQALTAKSDQRSFDGNLQDNPFISSKQQDFSKLARCCLKQDTKSNTLQHSTSDPGPQPPPRSSTLLNSPSRSDYDAQTMAESNDQFIADEDISVWSSSIQIDRPLSTENICRICHETDQVEQLISPCLCRGSLSLVHRSCLQHWLAESDSSTCELCLFIFITQRVPKYSVLGSVVAWMRQNRRQRKALLVDTLGMIAFVPFATIVTYIAAALADGIELHEQPSWADVTVRFAIVTFISFMTTVDVAYATYCMLRAQHHFSSWYSWYRRNSDVTLLPHQQQ